MSFQTSKRIVCCLMAALILCCAVVRPIEASATGLGATIASGTLIGLTKAQATAGVLAALGIGVAGIAGATDFEEIVSTISENIPADFIIETMSGTEMVEATLYQDVCYVYSEFVEWVNDYLYSQPVVNDTPILYPSTSEVPNYETIYKNTMHIAGSLGGTDILKNAKYLHKVIDAYGYYYYVWTNDEHIECDYSSRVVGIDGPSVSWCSNGETVSVNKDANLVLAHAAPSSQANSYPLNISTSASVTLSDRISAILDEETYALWLGKSLTLSDTTTAVLPISLGDTVADTGAISQTIAQAGTIAPSITYEKTDEIVYVDVPDVSNDLSGIITLLKAILEVLNNILQTCAVSIKSWINANAQAIIDANSGMLDASTAVSITNTQAIVDAISGIKFGDFSEVLTDVKTAVISGTTAITGTITDTIAEVIAKLAALGLTLSEILAAIKALALSITDAITAALTWAFVPSAGYFDAKVDSLMNAFPFFSNAMDTATQLKNFLFNLGSTPPIIYIDLAAGSGWYPMGGRTVFVDLTWYSAYKPTMDAVISAFLWLWFVWRLILSLPGIIQGTSGFWGQPLAMNPNGYLPSHGTVNETGISVKK